MGSTDVVTTTHASNHTATSWCAWVYRTGDSVSGNGRILHKPGAGDRVMYEDAGTNRYQLEVDWTTAKGLWSIDRPTANAWHQVCFTYNGTATTVDPIGYVDGAAVTTTERATPSGTLVTGSGVYSIGNNDGGTRVWNGQISEVAIWEGTILSAGNVATLWNSGAGLRADSSVLGIPPTAYWPLCGVSNPEPNAIPAASVGTVTRALKQGHPFANCPRALTTMGAG